MMWTLKEIMLTRVLFCLSVRFCCTTAMANPNDDKSNRQTTTQIGIPSSFATSLACAATCIEMGPPPPLPSVQRVMHARACRRSQILQGYRAHHKYQRKHRCKLKHNQHQP
mmetsp:Transcript_17207/g.48403  ORF Transcript_17207/g.48403 Transcript_17207/m.48403 type:complete len:111 (-) Transcript_17207:2810-3142(-)